MRFISWNCQGTNGVLSPKIPYIVWLIKSFLPMFVFLSETKTDFCDVQKKLEACSPTFACGVDVVGSKGGLVVLGWSTLDFTCIFKSSNLVVCKIINLSGDIWYVMFVYGVPNIEGRVLVWNQMLNLLQNYPNCILLGDFNQIEYQCDKLRGSNQIRGWGDFLDWRMNSNLLDIYRGRSVNIFLVVKTLQFRSSLLLYNMDKEGLLAS